MFQHIEEKTLYIFGIANALSIPMVWAFYPESNQRTLEEMDLLFAAKTPWNWDAERTFRRLKEEHPELVNANRVQHAKMLAGGDVERSTSRRFSIGGRTLSGDHAPAKTGDKVEQVEHRN
jgi:hypothetical protein